MDDAEFKRRLSEVAEWEVPKTPRETSLNAKKKRGRKSNEDTYMELREEMFQDEFGGVNPTYAPLLTKVKKAAVDCDDCGTHCPNGRQKEAKLHQKNGKNVWREKCITCGKFKNPFTGEFNLTGTAASIKFNDFMRETKGVYKTQGNEKRRKYEVIKETASSTVIENEQSIITFYHDFKQVK
jgi:Pyruvate/2-oxoacid:ferredoxin oxidoreductase delta subunit